MICSRAISITNSRTYPDGKVQTISYDLARNLPSGTNLNGAALATFGYDPVSWLVTGLTYGSNGTSVFGYTNERLATMASQLWERRANAMA